MYCFTMQRIARGFVAQERSAIFGGEGEMDVNGGKGLWHEGKDAKSKPLRQRESDVCGRDSIMRWCGKIETRSRCEQSQSPRDNARHRPIPKGLRPSAQGWRVSAYLGSSSNKPSTATRLRQFFAGRSCDVSHNPVGVVISFRRFPRVARTSQPWALGQNPVRILWATKISLLTELVGCAFGNGGL